eukprot:352467-Chlamydomonas_euryale.AAC.3
MSPSDADLVKSSSPTRLTSLATARSFRSACVGLGWGMGTSAPSAHGPRRAARTWHMPRRLSTVVRTFASWFPLQG